MLLPPRWSFFQIALTLYDKFTCEEKSLKCIFQTLSCKIWFYSLNINILVVLVLGWWRSVNVHGETVGHMTLSTLCHQTIFFGGPDVTFQRFPLFNMTLVNLIIIIRKKNCIVTHSTNVLICLSLSLAINHNDTLNSSFPFLD